MQLRVEKINDENDTKDTLGYANISDYAEMYKMLYFMKEHKCEFPIEIIESDNIFDIGNSYYVKDVSLVIPKCGGELQSCLIVYVEEEC